MEEEERDIKSEEDKPSSKILITQTEIDSDLCKLLKSKGYELIVNETFEEALSTLQEEDIPVVISHSVTSKDYSLTNFLRNVHEQDPSVKPIILTELAVAGQEVKVKKEGAYAFLLKQKDGKETELLDHIKKASSEYDTYHTRVSQISSRLEQGDNLETRAQNIVQNGKKTLLVLNDEQERNAIDSLLLNSKYYVEVVSSGEEAQEHIAQGDFDVVLTDIIMRDMDCVQLLNNINLANQMRESNIKTIALSQYSDRVEQLKTLQAVLLGADIIPKGNLCYDSSPGGLLNRTLKDCTRKIRKKSIVGLVGSAGSLIQTIKNSGYSVKTYNNVDEVIASGKRMHMIISEDIPLEDVGRLKEKYPHILLAADAVLNPNEIIQALMLGIDDVIYKDKGDFSTVVKGLIEQGKITDSAYNNIVNFIQNRFKDTSSPIEKLIELSSSQSASEKSMAYCSRGLVSYMSGGVEGMRLAISAFHKAAIADPTTSYPFALYTGLVARLPQTTKILLLKNLNNSLNQNTIKPYYFVRMKDFLLDEQKRLAEEEEYVVPSQPTRSKIMKVEGKGYLFYLKSAPLDAMLSYKDNANYFQRLNRRYDAWSSFLGILPVKRYKVPVSGFRTVVTDSKEPFIVEVENGNAPLDPEVFNQIELAKDDPIKLDDLISKCVRHVAYTCANGPIGLAKDHINDLEKFWEERLKSRVIDPISSLLKREEFSLESKLAEEGRDLNSEIKGIEKSFYEITPMLREALAAQSPKGYYSDWWTGNAAVNEKDDVYRFGFLRTKSGLPIVVDLASVFHFRDALSFFPEDEEQRNEREMNYVKQFFLEYTEAVKQGINKIAATYEKNPGKFIVEEFNKDIRAIRKNIKESETEESPETEEGIFFQAENLSGLKYVSGHPSAEEVGDIRKHFNAKVKGKSSPEQYFTELKKYAKDKGENVLEYVDEVEKFVANLQPKESIEVTEENLKNLFIPGYYNALCNRGMLMGGTLAQFTSEKLDKNELDDEGLASKLNDIKLSFKNAVRGIKLYNKGLSENPDYMPKEGEFEAYQRLEKGLYKLCYLIEMAKDTKQNETG